MKRKLTRPLAEYRIDELWRACDHGLIRERDVQEEIDRRLHLVTGKSQ